MYIYMRNTCMYIYIYMYLTPTIHTQFNDLSHDEKLIINSEIQTDLGASIKCILCEGKA